MLALVSEIRRKKEVILIDSHALGTFSHILVNLLLAGFIPVL